MSIFQKSERLSSKDKIDSLFNCGNSFVMQGFKIYWGKRIRSKSPMSILISIPKKVIPKSSERNRIKRLIRESYRRNKENYFRSVDNNKEINIAFILLHSDFQNYKSIEFKIKSILNRLKKVV